MLGFLKSSENLAAFGHFWPPLTIFFWRKNISGRHYKRSKTKTTAWSEYNSQVRQRNYATNQSINRSEAGIVPRSEPIRNSEFDWTSNAVHGKDFRRWGLIDPWGRDGTVLLYYVYELHYNTVSWLCLDLILNSSIFDFCNQVGEMSYWKLVKFTVVCRTWIRSGRRHIKILKIIFGTGRSSVGCKKGSWNVKKTQFFFIKLIKELQYFS